MVTKHYPGGGKSVYPPYTKEESREFDQRVFGRNLHEVKTIVVQHSTPRGGTKRPDQKPYPGPESDT